MKKKKSLGQHFLQSSHYVRLIAEAAHIIPDERVLEVGPGEGVLTKELLAQGARVVAVEKDARLMPLLSEKFSKEIEEENLLLREEDALEFDLEKNFGKTQSYKVVANIPYYITGALLRKLLSAQAQPSHAVLLIQKEVAERIVRSKKESLLSLSVKAYGTPAYIKTVPRGAFSPVPAVDSAILAISDISRNNFSSVEHEEKFFKLIHAGFAQKRKLLKRNVEVMLGPNAGEKLKEAGIEEKARAEDVSLQKWLVLSQP